MYVVAAEYYAKEGKEKEIIDILKKMIPLSRAEPGCKLYMVNQSPEDPRKLLLYEAVRRRGRIQGAPGDRCVQGEHSRQGRADARKPRPHFYEVVEP